MNRKKYDFKYEYPDHVEFQMASILFYEVDLLRQLEILKGRFDQIENYSHISMFKELDIDGDNEINVEDIINFMKRSGYETNN